VVREVKHEKSIAGVRS